jgi:hypothetical protein
MNNYFIDERVRVAISRTSGAGATAQANQAGTLGSTILGAAHFATFLPNPPPPPPTQCFFCF